MKSSPSLNIIFNQSPTTRTESILKYWLAMETPNHLPGLKFIQPDAKQAAIGALRVMIVKLLASEHLGEEGKKYCLEIIRKGIKTLSVRS